MNQVMQRPTNTHVSFAYSCAPFQSNAVAPGPACYTYTGLVAEACLPLPRLVIDARLLLLGLAGGATHIGVPGAKTPWPTGALATRRLYPTPCCGDSRDEVLASLRRERWGDKPRRVSTPGLKL